MSELDALLEIRHHLWVDVQAFGSTTVASHELFVVHLNDYIALIDKKLTELTKKGK